MKRQKFNRIIMQDGHFQKVAIEINLERKMQIFTTDIEPSAYLTAYSQGSGKDKVIYILAEQISGLDISLDTIEYRKKEGRFEYIEQVFFQDYQADQELGKDWRKKSALWKIKKLSEHIQY